MTMRLRFVPTQRRCSTTTAPRAPLRAASAAMCYSISISRRIRSSLVQMRPSAARCGTHGISVRSGQRLSLCYATARPWEYFRTQHSDMTPAEVAANILHGAFNDLPADLPHTIKFDIIGWTQRASHLEIFTEVFFHKEVQIHCFFGALARVNEQVLPQLRMALKKEVRVCFQPFLCPKGSLRTPRPTQ